MAEDKLKLIDAQNHRNGITGVPFKVAIFNASLAGENKKRRMVGIQFEDNVEYTAVFDLDMLAEGNIKFGSNSWRGPNFGKFLKRAKDQYIELLKKAKKAKSSSRKPKSRPKVRRLIIPKERG